MRLRTIERVLIAILVIALIALGIYAIVKGDYFSKWFNTNDKEVTASVNDVEPTPEEQLTADQASTFDQYFVVDLASMNQPAVVGYVNELGFETLEIEFNNDSLPINSNTRVRAARDAGLASNVISDAVEWPLVGNDEEAKFVEVKRYIFNNPVYGRMVAMGLADLKIDGSQTLGELNPWLVEFIETSNAALADTNATAGSRGIEIWLYAKDNSGKYYVTEEYERYALAMCQMLDRFVRLSELQEIKSSKNYCLAAILEPYNTQVTEADYQEKEPSLILEYRAKNGEIKVRIGFNVQDGRFEVFPTTTPTTTTKPTDPSPDPIKQPDPTPTPKPDPKPDPTPDPTPTPDPDPDPDPNPVKDPTQDPVNQGNAPQGGGHNDTDGPGTYQPDISNDPGQGGSADNPEDAQYQPPTDSNPGGGSTNPPADNRDEHKPDDSNPVNPHDDSHDNDPSGPSAGEGNGEFTMPD